MSTTQGTIQSLLAGHLGHLTSSQQENFQQFKDNLANANLYKPSVDGTRASHDEPTLLCVSVPATLSAPLFVTLFHQGVFCVPVDSTR